MTRKSICIPCANVECGALQYRTGSCGGKDNGFTCKMCSNLQCPPGQVQTGQCAEDVDGFQCAPCANLECGEGDFRVGECAGTSDGFTCRKQPVCEAGKTLYGSTNTTMGLCIPNSKLKGFNAQAVTATPARAANATGKLDAPAPPTAKHEPIAPSILTFTMLDYGTTDLAVLERHLVAVLAKRGIKGTGITFVEGSVIAAVTATTQADARKVDQGSRGIIDEVLGLMFAHGASSTTMVTGTAEASSREDGEEDEGGFGSSLGLVEIIVIAVVGSCICLLLAAIVRKKASHSGEEDLKNASVTAHQNPAYEHKVARAASVRSVSTEDDGYLKVRARALLRATPLAYPR